MDVDTPESSVPEPEAIPLPSPAERPAMEPQRAFPEVSAPTPEPELPTPDPEPEVEPLRGAPARRRNMMARMIEIDRRTLDGHECRLLTRDGARYPTSAVVECVTCRERVVRASGLHNYCAPAYFPGIVAGHVEKAKKRRAREERAALRRAAA